jgi:hypothetical protein
VDEAEIRSKYDAGTPHKASIDTIVSFILGSSALITLTSYYSFESINSKYTLIYVAISCVVLICPYLSGLPQKQKHCRLREESRTGGACRGVVGYALIPDWSLSSQLDLLTVYLYPTFRCSNIIFLTQNQSESNLQTISIRVSMRCHYRVIPVFEANF